MNVDYCLILCAGLGTRMGEIGKSLPKVIWPVFEKSLLELQIDYARSLGCENIFINIHHKAQTVIESLSDEYRKDIIFLHEEQLLGSGGAIHNLAKHENVNYNGNLLTINGDQFFFINRNQLENALQKLKDFSAVLFGLEVFAGSGYNETVVVDGRLTSIEKNNTDDKYMTFSGTGLINLNSLMQIEGESSFFNTVANYKENNVAMVFEEGIEYWDFGTLQRYQDSMFKVLTTITNKEKSSFVDFLISNNAILKDKVKKASYKSESEMVIDLTGENTVTGTKVIVFDKIQSTIESNSSIVFDDIIQDV